jgi:hypothetical protein
MVVSDMHTEAMVVMDVGRRKMAVKCDVYIQALYIYIYIYIYGYMEKTEMYTIALSEVKERENIFIQRND